MVQCQPRGGYKVKPRKRPDKTGPRLLVLVACRVLYFLPFPIKLVLCFVGDMDKPEVRGQDKARGDAS